MALSQTFFYILVGVALLLVIGSGEVYSRYGDDLVARLGIPPSMKGIPDFIFGPYFITGVVIVITIASFVYIYNNYGSGYYNSVFGEDTEDGGDVNMEDAGDGLGNVESPGGASGTSLYDDLFGTGGGIGGGVPIGNVNTGTGGGSSGGTSSGSSSGGVTGNGSSTVVTNTRTLLAAKCPVVAGAGGMITTGSTVTRDDYLFSACEGDGTCENVVPTGISKKIIEATESCGNLLLKSQNLAFSQDTSSWVHRDFSATPQKTVRERLLAKCPVRADAKGMINPGNSATHSDYLFSACTAAGSCDKVEADPISLKLLQASEHCGAWSLRSQGIEWSNARKRWEEKDFTVTPETKVEDGSTDKKAIETKTTQSRLMEKCPRRSDANGMINKGNLASYENYLFSACKEAGSCDKGTPDFISQKLLDMKEHCGAWDIKSQNIKWNNSLKKWETHDFTKLTTEEQLKKRCPKQADANGMINKGNILTYDTYLFSGCKAANTCNSQTPDPISQKLINMKEHCGSWDIKSQNLKWNNASKKWEHHNFGVVQTNTATTAAPPATTYINKEVKKTNCVKTSVAFTTSERNSVCNTLFPGFVFASHDPSGCESSVESRLNCIDRAYAMTGEPYETGVQKYNFVKEQVGGCNSVVSSVFQATNTPQRLEDINKCRNCPAGHTCIGVGKLSVTTTNSYQSVCLPTTCTMERKEFYKERLPTY